MRLTRHLNEATIIYEEDIERMAKIIQKECKQAVIEMRQAKNFLWRGFGISVDRFAKHKTRQDRRPLDTTVDMHKLMDKIFKEKFGWFPRSQGLICSNDMDTAGEYGKIRAIFPIGRYKCIWKPGTMDVREISPYWAEQFFLNPKYGISEYMRFSFHRKNYGDIDLNAPWDDQVEDMEKIIEKMLIDAVSRFKQTGLKEPLGYRGPLEIMVQCKEYYSAEWAVTEDLAYELKIKVDW
jgi:hypothetical protein